MNRSTMLPVGMVIVIVFVILMTMTTGRTNAPQIAVDRAYSHQICTTNRYCVGEACVDAPLSFVVYPTHEDGAPRLDFLGWNPQVRMNQTANGLEITSFDGVISGTITIFNDRKLRITATSYDEDTDITKEHYASGSCERPVTR